MGSLPPPPVIERTVVGNGLEIPRMVNGLWQLAGGHDESVDIVKAAQAMEPIIEMGMNCFDMADHYGDAELVVGKHNSSSGSQLTAFTKWCPPETGDKSFETAEAAIDLALKRMGQKQLPLLQYHAWDYSDDTYHHNLNHLKVLQEQGKIANIGLTNTDAGHLQMLIDSGHTIATNQVPCNVIDQRVKKGRLAKVCLKHDVGLLCYGTLMGGFLSEKWVNKPEPATFDELNWSLRKYLRFIKTAGGWGPFQVVLKALDQIAKRHGVPISAVATRYVLDLPAVSAIIVGTRLSDNSQGYSARNMVAFSIKLSEEDHALISEAQSGLSDIPGDLGDEYRRPPFLTAAGDMSHHLEKIDRTRKIDEAIADGKRIEYSLGPSYQTTSPSYAVRVGSTIRVIGVPAISPISSMPIVGGLSARSQTVAILDLIEGALSALGSSLADVIQAQVTLRNGADYAAVAEQLSWAFDCVGNKPMISFAKQMPLSFVQCDVALVEVAVEAEEGTGTKGVATIEKR